MNKSLAAVAMSLGVLWGASAAATDVAVDPIRPEPRPSFSQRLGDAFLPGFERPASTPGSRLAPAEQRRYAFEDEMNYSAMDRVHGRQSGLDEAAPVGNLFNLSF